MGLKAVILAAGQGKRLLPLTREIPKALLPLNGSTGLTILEYQVELLEKVGVDEILVVVGHGRERIKALLKDRVTYVVNPDYPRTNSIYSFYLAMGHLDQEVLILNGDVLFPGEVLERLLDSEFKAVLSVDTGALLDEETMKVVLEGQRVVDIRKDLSPREAHGENLGVVLFRSEALSVLMDVVKGIVGRGEVNCWIPAAFREMLPLHPVYAVDVKGLPWIEIDFPQDLEEAQKEIYRKIAGEV
jgi:choline kinase